MFSLFNKDKTAAPSSKPANSDIADLASTLFKLEEKELESRLENLEQAKLKNLTVYLQNQLTETNQEEMDLLRAVSQRFDYHSIEDTRNSLERFASEGVNFGIEGVQKLKESMNTVYRKIDLIYPQQDHPMRSTFHLLIPEIDKKLLDSFAEREELGKTLQLSTQLKKKFQDLLTKTEPLLQKGPTP